MANPIRYSDIFDFTSDKDIQKALTVIKNLDKIYVQMIGNAKKLAPEYAKSQKQVADAILSVANASNKLNPTIEKDRQQLAAASKSMDILTASSEGLTKKTATLGTTIKKLEAEQKKVNAKTKETIRLENEEAKLKARLASLNSKEAQSVQRLRVQIQEKNKQLKRSAQESLKLVSIYDRESKRLAELSKRYKDYVVAGKQGTNTARQLKREHDQLRASIVRADQATGQFNRNVGNYPKRFALAAGGVRQLAAALGFTGVVFALVGAFRNAFNTIRSFQKENAVLAGVLNKTRSEIGALTGDAQRLGSITAKTSSEVTTLQIAYARLGFTQGEIIDLTEDTINGSIALNAELSETAELTGAIIRTFDDLGTMDADVVLDQMTAATQRSALEFSKLQTAIPIVAGAANAAGIPLTRLLALLGKLSDAGIDASMSATALRNIFIESASQGLSYNEILEKISESQDQLTTSTDEFGKRAAVSGTILSNLTEETDKLDKTLQRAGGTAKRVADEQLSTLDGTIKLLASAWEGFILGIENGDGVLQRLIRGTLTGLTSFLQTITTELKDQISPLEQQRQGFLALTNALIHLNPTEDERARIIDKINTEYEEYLPNLIDEKTTLDEIQKIQEKSNDTFLKTILLRQQQEKLNKIAEVQVRLAEESLNLQSEQGEIIQKNQKLSREYDEEVASGNIARAKQIDNEIRANQDRSAEIDSLIQANRELQSAGTRSSASLQIAYENLKRELGLLEKATESAEKATRDFGNDQFNLSQVMDDGRQSIIDWENEAAKAAETGDLNVESLEKFILSGEEATGIIKEQDQALKDSGEQADTWRDKMERAAQKVALAIDAAFQVASTAVNQFFTNQSIKADNAFVEFEEKQQSEIDALEAKREKELENENLTAEAKKAINQRYADSIGTIEDQIDKKRKQVQRDQAKSEKAQALFNAILNTAQAITQTIATLGLPAAIPFVAAAGVIGAAQIAAIASQPLPKFAKGTDNAPGGLAVVGEKGRELVMEPSGKTYLTGSGPELRDVPKGSQILTNVITERILRQNAIVNEGENYNQSAKKIQGVARQEKFDGFRQALKLTMEKENDYMVSKFISGLQSLPLNNWSFTDKGQVTRSVQKGNTIRKDVELENKY